LVLPSRRIAPQPALHGCKLIASLGAGEPIPCGWCAFVASGRPLGATDLIQLVQADQHVPRLGPVGGAENAGELELIDDTGGAPLPGGRHSMSPLPSSVSAPFWSRIVRLSTLADTRKATRQGKFALMRPVITFTEGRCVASTRWIPMARAFCASVARGVSISPCTVSIRSASSSTISTMYGTTPPVYSPSSGSSFWIPACVARVSRGS